MRELLDVQQYDNKDSEIAQLQEKLNNCYDSFYSKYGLLHSSYNHSLLNSDGAYPLVASLEADFAKDNNLLVKKSDIFTERVNKPTATISHVDTAEEALAVCVAEKGVIDFEYMSQITDVPPEDLKIGLREKVKYLPYRHIQAMRTTNIKLLPNICREIYMQSLTWQKHTLRSTAYMNQMLSP